MLEPELVAIGARHLERLLIILAGALSVWLGYRLFINMPLAEKGAGKIQLPGGISVFISRVGPGVFFALFGAVVLSYGLHQAVTVEVRPRVLATGPGTAPAQAAAEASLRYSGVGSTRSTAADRGAERDGMVRLVGELGRVADALKKPPALPLSAEQRLDFGLSLADARARLLAGVWDDKAWGPFPEFQRWIRDGEPDPPPAAIAGGARAFRGR